MNGETIFLYLLAAGGEGNRAWPAINWSATAAVLVERKRAQGGGQNSKTPLARNTGEKSGLLSQVLRASWHFEAISSNQVQPRS
jgi:hypothetical protein